MNSLSNYSKNKINYFNSLSNNFENNYVPITESALISTYGKEIDSILYKINLCTSRYSNNLFFEGADDVLFTIEEQYAVRDLLIFTCKTLLDNICEEYELEVPILEGENNTLTNIKNYLQKVHTAAKQKASEFKAGIQEVTDKIKAIKEFIKEVTSNAIKSAKELASKFLNLMSSIKDTLGQIFEKLGGKIDEIQNEFKDRIVEVINDKSKRPKETVYEQLQHQINNGVSINEEQIFELFGLGKNKDKEENKQNNKNEYDKSLEGGNNNEKKGKGKSIILSILKQIAISITVLIIIPALIGCAWGPAAGMIAATIAKAAMTGYGFYKYVKNIYQTISSGKFKKANKWKKLGYIFLWILSFALLAWGAKKAGEDIIKCWDAFKDGNLKQLVPDKVIQGAMELINKIWKSITGSDTPGFEELNKITQNGIVEWEKIEETKGKTNDDFTTKELKNLGDTNDFDAIQKNVGDEISSKLKDVADAPLKTSKAVQDAAIKAVDPSNLASDTHVVFLDGNTAAKMARDGLLNSADGAQVSVHQITNTALQSSTNGQAGTLFMVVVKGSKDSAQEIANQAIANASSHGVSALTKVISGTATETVTKMVATHIPAISGGFAPIVALPAVFKKKVNKGFLLRLGSGRSGNNIYVISEDGYKSMSFKEVEEKCGEINPPVFAAMKKTIDKNYKMLIKTKEDLEKKSNLDKAEKKKLKEITNTIEKMKGAVSEEPEYECIVFYSKKEIEAQKPSESSESETNEGFIDKLFSKKEKPEVKKIEYSPVMFINPLCMTCGDLADTRNNRGPRKKPIYIKGLFGSYEFLPGAEGMNEKDINEMLVALATESLKAAWNMTADAPCIKKGRKSYVENEDSVYKGKERDDFGKFTNTEITEIFNNPSAITKYMGGKYSKRSTVEKENTENQKERKQKAKEEWKNNIENNEEVKKLLDTMPDLKDKIKDKDGKVKPEALDELSDAFLRMETSYNKGEDKKTLWQKIKNIFSKDSDTKEKYNSDEVQKLAYKLASLHAKKMKGKRKKEEVKESYNIDYLEELDEAIKNFELNMNDLLSEDFVKYLDTNILNEDYEKYIELIAE